MKILQTKISTPIAYTLIVFVITSVALVFYGQFSKIDYEVINNNSDLQVVAPSNSVDVNTPAPTTPSTDATTIANPESVAPVSEPIPAPTPAPVSPTDSPDMRTPSTTMPVSN